VTAPTLGSFSAVDDDPASAALVTALDSVAAMPAVQRLRGSATDLLAVRSGHRLLDVGCGTGDVARVLAALVGSRGSVVGIDPSRTMLAEARRRTPPQLAVEYRVGDAARLDLDDGAVDGSRCERVLQHVAEPERAMAELVRVTKPGGQVVVIDTDWGMHAIHGAAPHLTAKVVAAWVEVAANGWSGRRLPALFAGEGIRRPVVVAETFTSTDPEWPSKPPFTVMAQAAERCGALPPGDGDEWLRQLGEAARHDRFFWAATMFAVAGAVPART
jgi:SAM-dependent methyltransferase